MPTFDEVFKKHINELIPKQSEDFRFNFEQSNSFLTWITGISSLGITLIIANSDKLITVHGRTSKIIILEFFISILLAVVYKIFSYTLLGRYQLYLFELKMFTEPPPDLDISTVEIPEREKTIKEYHEFLINNIGMTQKDIDRFKKKKVFPLGYYIGRVYYGSIFTFVIGISILICDYIF